MKEMILKTKRLLLRELKQDDFDDICKLLQDPIVMYAYEGAFSKKEVQEWLDKQLRRYQNDGFGLWGMIGQSIVCGIKTISAIFRVSFTSAVCVIGYD